jgi:hypothetical protein
VITQLAFNDINLRDVNLRDIFLDSEINFNCDLINYATLMGNYFVLRDVTQPKTSFKNRPVWLSSILEISSGVPSPTI